MANIGMIQKVMAFSPHVEMVVRRLYRTSFINRFLSKKKKKKTSVAPVVDFKKLIQYLQSIGIKKGDLLIIHSAFRPLKGSGLSPVEIVNNLIELVGEEGTLAMPVIRKYPESPSDKEAMTADISEITFTYNVAESKVWTGILPYTLMKMKGAVTSRFPLNTLTAIGKHAELMMKDNLKGERPTPNGVHSPWKYCTDQNAWVVSIGTDLTHSLTMIHTAEDVQKEKWPVKNWYREKHFKIIDGDFSCEKTVLERHPKWGMLHFGERTLAQDLLDQNVMTSHQIQGVLVETLRAKPLYDFLNAKNKNGYPYFWI